MKPTRETNPIETGTPKIADERREQLRELFPDVFTEGKVECAKLRTAVGDLADEMPERYTFSWAGKRKAVQLLQTPTRATLVPVQAESIAPDDTQNVYIEGENLEVLKLLYKPYFGRVKMIYIDPPYNTGNDFIYTDNYTDPLAAYLQMTGQQDASGNLLTSNTETSGRFHSAWLSMIYPRLVLARQLLREDGIIFVSIDDHEVHNLRMVMNEVFGEENFITTVIWQKVYAPKNTARHFSEDHDYVLVYARGAEVWEPSLLPRSEEANSRYINPDNDPRGPWKPSDLTARNYYSQGQYEVTGPTGKRFRSGVGRYWRSSYQGFLELDKDKRIWWGEDGSNMPAQKRFLSEVQQGMTPQTLWFYQDVGHTQEAKKQLLTCVKYENTENVLNSVKPTRLIRRMLQIATTPDEHDIIVDFFAGSASTAHAVIEQNAEDGGNRQFICVQFPEPLPIPEAGLKTIADVGKERLRTVLSAIAEKQAKQQPIEQIKGAKDLGFRVFRLAPSNFRLWEGVKEATSEQYVEQMALYNDSLVEGWTPEKVIQELALKEGYSLTSRAEVVEGITEQTFYRVTDPERAQSFTLCLDEHIKKEALEPLALQKDDSFICRDSALDDEAAANLALQCRLKLI